MSLRMRYFVHPVVRQFILRTAVLNYLIKDLNRQWIDWQSLTKLQVEKESPESAVESEQKLTKLREKVNRAHSLLRREYTDLFAYMMDKQDVWDTPEYAKASSALAVANRTLKSHLIAGCLESH